MQGALKGGMCIHQSERHPSKSAGPRLESEHGLFPIRFMNGHLPIFRIKVQRRKDRICPQRVGTVVHLEKRVRIANGEGI